MDPAQPHSSAAADDPLAELRALCGRVPRGGDEPERAWCESIGAWLRDTAGLVTPAGEPSAWGRVAIVVALEALLAYAQRNPAMPVPAVVCDWLRVQFRGRLLGPDTEATWETMAQVLQTITAA